MKHLLIICEGETELEFCKDVLHSHFIEKNICIHYPLIKKSKGGIVKWDSLKKEIESHLKSFPAAYVTILIDFYGIEAKHNFPNFNGNYSDNESKVNAMEQGMKDSFEVSVQHRFIPYIQLHEFECFMFCSLETLKQNFKDIEADFVALKAIVDEFSNVENINNGAETAPSKRLAKHIKGYDKVVHGACLTSSIGLPAIRSKCPRFDNWISQLENI